MTEEERLEITKEIEKLRLEVELAKIEAKKKADLEIEQKKAEYAYALEQQRGDNNLRVENRKGIISGLVAIGGVILGAGLTVWANNHDVSQRDISTGSGYRRLLK